MELTGTTVIPLASPDDAKTTAEAAAPYIETADHVILVHVVEKAGGAPDKVPVEQREEYAEEIFEVAEETISSEGVSVETRLLYSTEVADAVFELCDEVGASSVVVLPRESNRLLNVLVGDRMRSFIEDNDLPVVCLPSDSGSDSDD